MVTILSSAWRMLVAKTAGYMFWWQWLIAWCSDEQPQSSGLGQDALSDRQQQLPGAAESLTQAQHVFSKLSGQNLTGADAKDKPSLTLQARTGGTK